MAHDINNLKGKVTRAPEGEVVYRRVALRHQESGSRGPNQPRFDPTLMPLLVGCAFLLLFVIVLGNLSVRRVEDTSREVLIVEQQFAARAALLLQLRIALTQLDHEARDKMEAQTRHELRPPFDMRLGTARSDLVKLIPPLDKPHLRNYRNGAFFTTIWSLTLRRPRMPMRIASTASSSFNARTAN